LQIIVGTRERYAYRFTTQQAVTVKRALPCGDYGVMDGGRLIAVAERKSLPDLVSSLMSGSLRFQLGELSALPRAAVVVEERYSRVFALSRVRPVAPEPASSEVRAWARATGLEVAARGRLRSDVWQAWRDAHTPGKG